MKFWTLLSNYTSRTAKQAFEISKDILLIEGGHQEDDQISIPYSTLTRVSFDLLLDVPHKLPLSQTNRCN